MSEVVKNEAEVEIRPKLKKKKESTWYDFIRMFVMVFFASQLISKYFGKKSDGPVEIRPDGAIALTENLKLAREAKVPNQLETLFGIDSVQQKEVIIFPTHDENGILLSPNHESLIKQDSSVIFDLHIYMTENEKFNYSQDFSHLVWTVPGIKYGWEYTDAPTMELNVTVTDSLRNNGSYYAHTFFLTQPNTMESITSADEYDNKRVVYNCFPLVKFKVKKRPKVLRKLLDTSPVIKSDDDAVITNITDTVILEAEEEKTNATLSSMSDTKNITIDPIVAYWQHTLDLNMVLDMPSWSRNKMNHIMLNNIKFTSDGSYHPIVYHNNFWTMSKSLQEINSTTTILPLSISFSHIAFWKWTIQLSMVDSWENQQRTGLGTERDADMLRETLLETSPWLLILTFVISLLHMLFDFLAFKNDVQFWRKKKSMEGLSVRSLGVNCFFQTIIFLYLFDNDTSTLILLSTGVGLLIEYWKLHKAFNCVITWKPFRINWKLSESYTSNETQTHDQVATTHLLYALMPLIVGYSAYSLLHNPHKSFYSWALGSLVGFVYAFGFIMMTPQLYINYKLKSVAHMPWKAMVYKALNTFIDDFFAFIIKMPTLHRLACLRDDFIFIIYLYQRWVYRVDYSRSNEYGQVGTVEATEEQSTVTDDGTTETKVIKSIQAGNDPKETISTEESTSKQMNNIDE